MAHIIVGLGFGDEGKGLVTDYFCSKTANPIVIRFNGGQQAGHTVFLKNGRKHIFSNFGSGSLRGVPTFWSRYCTFCPGFFLEERDLLGDVPDFFIDKSCPVTTHYDILYNRIIEAHRGSKRHGSCGLGFGATLKRHVQLPTKFTVADLVNRKACIKKLGEIKNYYKKKIQQETNFLFSAFDHEQEDKQFMSLVTHLNDLKSKRDFRLAEEDEIFGIDSDWQTYIFEGAQGILLDVNFGRWPYVTKSNTTSKNALYIIDRNFKHKKIQTNIAYVTRAYQTRHGKGPFRESKPRIKLKNTRHEINVFNEYQGEFRVGRLDFNLLNYSIKCDQRYSGNLPKHLFITCLDQINPLKIPVFIDYRKRDIRYEAIQLFIDSEFKSVHYSFSRYTDDLS